ncbi:uncharacterized protein Z519_08887 [Cladophialophora bantiana CBS 173.52]|uniref:Uncharacterized protein n=1 Tax=Cladophialophora bantiana (strain ATCC 10958 / CBS 173.52 / CDC B-1940 / NIH 8579) TaxID=1442370 RepID=A0A0D2HAE2_CLAB1|nr:uncharacterized protein Z519_08887 [Cladophialophora bantiana CBS 173.52]KIW90243.1 hypothetical protein Z519_08887 [Cladophialophora bantiana CBS 173.52]
MTTATAKAAAAAQRRAHPADCNPKCFPYVMHPSSTTSTISTTHTTNTTNISSAATGKQRNRSQNPNHSRNLSHSYHGAPRQWQDPVQRPATANPAIHRNDDSAPVARPTRSRSRLQKRPSQQMLKTSASISAMSQTASRLPRPSLDQKDITALAQSADQAVPQRSFSVRKKSFGTTDRPKAKKGSSDELKSPASTSHAPLSLKPKSSPAEHTPKPDSDSEKSSSAGSPSPPNPIRTPRYQPLAPNDPSPLNPLYHIPSSYFSYGTTTETMQSVASPNPNTVAEKNEQVLLPPGLKPGKSEDTEVEEVVRPAVTHEVIKREKKEMVQEEITREIHVHHYYTYTQPIKAIEVLPARHFLVDAETGKKVEIPAPEGWVMPNNLQPYKPDPSGIGAVTRHSLVDEEHPNGVLEPAPLNIKRKESQQDMKTTRKATSTGNWTPFPKVR